MTATGNGHQRDTVVLGQDMGVLGQPGPPAPTGTHDAIAAPTEWAAVPRPAMPAGWGPPPVWSQVPPFLPSPGAPVVIARNNAAVIGATLGSVALFLSIIPLIGIVAWVLAPIGLLSSGIGLVVGMGRRVGRVGAIWGLVTSGLALIICSLWVALVLAL